MENARYLVTIFANRFMQLWGTSMSNKNETVGNSLIPIKGISQAQKKALNTKCQIYDISGLLSKGRTPEQRKAIADKLGLSKKYVNLWVKQADLWRVMGMTADYAYLLVLAGVRTVSDLAKVNVEKTQQMLLSLSNTHPGFNWDKTNTSILISLVFNAALLESTSISQTLQQKRVGDFENVLQENFQKILLEQIEKKNEGNAEIDKNAESFKQILTSFNWNNAKIGSFASDDNKPDPVSLQQLPLDMSDEDEPEYLFEKSYKEEPIGKSDSEVIEEGLGFLQDIAISLPLPRIISGLVKIRSQNEDKSKSKTTAAVSDLLVELTGVINPMTESKEDSAPVSAYTDGNGRFNLVMPDKYNFQDSVTFTFSYGSWKQSFTKTASEIIENTVIRDGGTDENGKPLTAQMIISQFDLLDSTNKEIKQLENKKNVLGKIEFWKTKKAEAEDELSSLLKENNGENNFISETDIKSKEEEIKEIKAEIDRLEKGKIDLSITKTEDELKKEIENKEKEREDILAIIYGADSTTNDFEKTLTNLMARTDLESCFDGDENDDKCKNKCFVIIEEVFKGYRDSKPKALPSVRLMGEGDTATWLPTDTAPSRTYSYTMLQRLVEPAIYPSAGENRQRKKLTSPINVATFKNDVMTNPESIPKMASLGIGYVLNMHQAWVPDGFALGTLLYSLILAPGEEQRLIVREHSENYEILDTFEGSDETSESTSRSQTDDIQAIYDYMMHQDSSASSKSTYKSSGWSIGGSASGGGGGFSLGLSGGYSKSKGSSTTTSRQSNNQNEASNAAQSFNQEFATTANLLAKAKRVSIRTASSSETDSVATKIIANHNHSHAMTVQYWEVVRRYRLETCIDGVDLLLFVPLELVRFLPKGQTLNTTFDSSFGMDQFSKRYSTLIQYYSTLRYALPYKYRSGLDLIQKFSALPNWRSGDNGSVLKEITVTFNANIFDHDEISARLYFKNGKGSVVGRIAVDNTIKLSSYTFYSTEDVKTFIRNKVNDTKLDSTVKMTFSLPVDTLPDEISSLYISHEFIDTSIPLSIDPNKKEYYDNWGDKIDLDEIVKNYWDKLYDVKKDTKNTVEDSGKMDYWRSQIPEAYFTPITHLSARELKNLGYTKFSLNDDNNPVEFQQSSDSLYYGVSMYANCKENYLHRFEFQKMEETLQHVASETLRYSQRVWQTLSSNELAIMLEQYNIDMNFKTYFDVENDSTYIPLLNCVNVKRVMGYYGNCILLPFTYPEELAVKLGKTAAEIQDSLYRYHTSCFRAPSTTISIPTDGMIGEAVLGATNVSEEIDLTRFWNWKDSPIDSMTLDSSYLSGGDYLGNKTTKDFGALNLQTATQQTPVTATDLISALVAKQTPQFDNITGLEQTATLLNNAMNSTSTGRDNVINQSSTLAGKAMEYATQKLKSESAERVAQINASKNKDQDGEGTSKPDSNNSGGNNKPETKNPDDGKGSGEGKKPEEKNKDSSLDSVIDGMVNAIKKGDSPEKFFTDITGESDTSMKGAAEKLCSWLGSDLGSVLNFIMN
jgi:hypothetical protein